MGFSSKSEGAGKIEKYGDVKRKAASMWNMAKMVVILVVIGALGEVSKELNKWTEKIGINVRMGHLQKTAFLGTGRILRKVLDT